VAPPRRRAGWSARASRLAAERSRTATARCSVRSNVAAPRRAEDRRRTGTAAREHHRPIGCAARVGSRGERGPTERGRIGKIAETASPQRLTVAPSAPYIAASAANSLAGWRNFTRGVQRGPRVRGASRRVAGSAAVVAAPRWSAPAAARTWTEPHATPASAAALPAFLPARPDEHPRRRRSPLSPTRASTESHKTTAVIWERASGS
jgi:hypothetical protein